MIARQNAAVGGQAATMPDEAILLEGVQAFIKQRLQGALPDALLSHFWDDFYSFYDEVIRRMASYFRVPRQNVDDVTQEVWLSVLTHLADFRWNESQPGLRAWLAAIVRNKAIDQVRRQGRYREQLLPNERLPEEAVTLYDDDPAKLFAWQWQVEVLNLATEELRSELSPENRAIFEMRITRQLPVAEVASTLQLPPDRVSDRHRWLLRKLRALMDLYTGHPFGLDEGGKPG